MARGSAALAELPWRGPGHGRPELPLPPDRLPLAWNRRPRKQWRYVNAFCEQFMLCAASVRIGPLGQSFWAVLDRERNELHERTRTLLPGVRGEVWSEREDGGPWLMGAAGDGLTTRVEAGDVTVSLAVGGGEWVESICPNGEAGYVWTRKRLAPIECAVRLPGGRKLWSRARGIEDESAGYHPRHTVWRWSAGIGELSDGREVGWNLVAGVNDPPERSERAIWVDGEPFEPDPVRFADDLGAIDFADGARLEFAAEAERRATERKPLIRSSYRQPFGRFGGTLPGGLELAAGLGVMEHHDAHW